MEENKSLDHVFMSKDTIENLLYIHRNMSYLNEYEKQLIDDRIQALSKYKTSAVVTKKQRFVINRIALRLKTDIKIEKQLEGV